MIIINVKDSGSIERALKLLKRKFENTKTLRELRDRKTFTKPSEEKRLTKLKAIHKNEYDRSNS